MNENNTTVENKPKKLKPNIIDFLIVIAILAAAAGILLRTGIMDDAIDSLAAGRGQVEKVRIKFLIQDINRDSYDYFIVGDRYLASSLKNCDAGELEYVDPMQPAEAYINTISGEIIKTTSPLLDPGDPMSFTRIDVTGAIVCEGIYDKDGYFLMDGEHSVTPGSVIRITSKNIDVALTVMDIERMSETEDASVS